MESRFKYPDFRIDRSGRIAAFVIGIIFLITSTCLMIWGYNLLFLIPLMLLMILLAFIAIDKLLLLTLFLIPLSIQLRFIYPETPVDIFLPTELILPGILILMMFKVFITKEIDRTFLFHPVSIISICMFGWCLVTAITGTMIVVSLKSFLTRVWFFASFYLLAGMLFRKPEKIRSYFLAYITGMIPVVVYFLLKMWQVGLFNQAAAYTSVRPFFNDHTALGASLAFTIPMVIFIASSRKSGLFLRFVMFGVLIIFSAAFIFSYSRAAWLSLAVSAVFTLAVILKIGWKVYIPGLAIFCLVAITSWPSVLIRLKENRKESSGNISTHIESIANIRSDASNMERINRWKAALRMSDEKPVFGWGPGTYQFKYAPFQMASEKTVISTNYGERGNAHSEYLGALAESGIPGMLFYISLVAVALWRGSKTWRGYKDKESKYLLLALMAGLVTYVIHGGLNNFLDTDKISALFWGILAAMVALENNLREDVTIIDQ
jgi:putative inorganic carbon (hco3(-)) transporter